jgi:hypothetical protein
MLGSSGKHVTAVARQWPLYYFIYVGKSKCFFLAYFPYSESVCVSPIVFARQQLGNHVHMAMNTHAAIEELLDTSYSMWCVSYQLRVGG